MTQNNGRTYEKLPRPLTDEEVIEAGHELARQIRRLAEIEQERKAFLAQLRAEHLAVREQTAELTMALNNGWREADVEVLAMMDTPSPGTKTIIRLDTNTEVRTVPMTDAERQDNFGFMREAEQ